MSNRKNDSRYGENTSNERYISSQSNGEKICIKETRCLFFLSVVIASNLSYINRKERQNVSLINCFFSLYEKRIEAVYNLPTNNIKNDNQRRISSHTLLQ